MTARVVATVHPSSLLRQPDEEERARAYRLFVADLRVAARAIAPALQKIFRAGLNLEALGDAGSLRARRLARLALAYRTKLRDESLIDPDEALW